MRGEREREREREREATLNFANPQISEGGFNRRRNVRNASINNLLSYLKLSGLQFVRFVNVCRTQ